MINLLRKLDKTLYLQHEVTDTKRHEPFGLSKLIWLPIREGYNQLCNGLLKVQATKLMLLLTMLIVGLSGSLFAQTVTTFTVPSPDIPTGIAINPNTGDVYFQPTIALNTTGKYLSKLSSTGVLTKVAVNLPSMFASNNVYGIAIDNAGNLYVPDVNSTAPSRIIKISADLTTINYNWATMLTADAYSIRGIDNAGNMLVTTRSAISNPQIEKIGPSGGTSTFLSNYTQGGGIVGIMNKTTGDFYYYYNGNGFSLTPINKLTLAGVNTPSWGGTNIVGLGNPMVFDSQGNLFFMAGGTTKKIYKIAPNGTTNYNWYTAATGFEFLAMTIDAADNIYINVNSGTGSFTTTKVTPAGVGTPSWASVSGGLANDPAKGNIYAFDNNKIHRIGGAAVACAAGSTAPTLSGTTKSNTCPTATADISSLITSTTPSGASVVWYTNAAHTGTAYSTPTTAAAGTYYAFYYDATGACYSPASAAVTVTITSCTDTDGDGVLDSVDIDDDNDGILDVTECAACISAHFANGSFETPVITGGAQFVAESTTGLAWKTTATDHIIEIQKVVPAAEGTQFVELNANQVSTLYQTFCVNGVSGSTVNWSIKHRGRDGVDVATVSFGPNLNSLTAVQTMSDGNNAWGAYSGVYNIPAGQTQLVIAFVSVSAAGGNQGIGNYLDDIQITINQGCADTDGDGIVNSLDLDSDGDGCSDAKEAGATTSNVANFSFPTSSVGANGLSSSVETNDTPTAGINYTSTYSQALNNTIKNCVLCGGISAPTLSGTTKSNTCPATTANISSLVSSTAPSGTSVVWFTNAAHTGTAYSTPTTAAAGTYYAFYYDATNACYSPASVAVTVTITSPCPLDTDGDGVTDATDIDDDNDGVLDTTESPTVKTTYSYTGSNQSFTVPAGVTAINVAGWGAGGASSNGGTIDGGGAGAYGKATFSVTAGDVITIVVGEGGKAQSAQSTTATFGGGGAGGTAPDAINGASGGGRSAILINSNEVFTIAGGGGAGSSTADNQKSFAGAGGGGTLVTDGAGNTYRTGQAGTVGVGDTNSATAAGQGGTSTAGGAGGAASNTAPGQAGSAFAGGAGGNATGTNAGGGGGGGGGKFGGGGGIGQLTAATPQDRAGGGGSSFISVLGTNISLLGGNLTTVPNTTDVNYSAGIAVGGTTLLQNGGNGKIVLEYTSITDTDSDGIVNSLDLDSDGDGCSDAREAGATTSNVANFSFPSSSVGANGLSSSVETNDTPTAGINYTSTYSNAINNTITNCILPCTAGTTAPTLSGTTASNACPATTANISSLVTSTAPSGTSVVWFTDAAHTGTAYSTPTTADAGTYYAFYYDATNTCYSPASAAVTVTVNSCAPIALSNACPSSTVNLTTAVSASNLPSGTTVTYHTATPATTANKVTDPTAAGAGTYYAAFFDATNDCYSPVSTSIEVTITPCPPIALSNACPSNTVNLTTAVSASNLPSGTTVTYHTATPATTANKVTDPTTVGAGTYYAAFFDATNDCYSPVSTSIEVTITPCAPIALSNVCPLNTVNLTTAVSANNLPSGTTVTYHTATPATTANKVADPTIAGAGTYYAAFFDATNDCYSPASVAVTVSITVCCSAGTTAPTLSGTTASNACPTTTANISNLVTSTAPSGTSVVWFTDAAHTGTAYSTPTTAGAGTYYAFYYDATNDCYSPASTPIEVTVTPCAPIALSNVCPLNTVNLTTAVSASNLPSGTTVTYHTATPATTANKVTDPTAAGAGTYYAAFFDATNDCYSPVSTSIEVTITPCPPIALSNTCPSNTVNLTTAVSASNLPSGTTVTYHTATPATTANKVTDPTAAGAGTYYAAFFDATNDCYSPVSTSIEVTITPCPPIALSNTCPSNTVNLTTAVSASNLPSGTTVTYHTATPATTANKVTDPTAAGAGTYYAAFFDATNDCYSPVSTSIEVTINTCTFIDLITTIAQPTPSPVAGQPSNIPVTVANIGTAPTTGTITEIVEIPAGTTFGTFPASNNGWTCTTAGTTATCTNAAPIANGANSTFNVPFIPTVAQIGSPLTVPAATVSGGGELAVNNTNNSSIPVTTPNVDGDNDGDGVSDANDLDDDNDGILDTVENAACAVASASCDTDGDGIPNRLDLDSDNDGISDLLESGNPGIIADTNNDGTISASENPVGANGIPLEAESGIEGGFVPNVVDIDGDGKADPYDLDSDNDGIFDVVEGGNGALDTNNDGVISSTDTGYADVDTDGIADGTDSNTTAFGGTDTPSVISDSDGDGIKDFRELDSDKDGLKDLAESGYGLPDTNADGIVDGTDTDGDGLVNASTLDTNATFGGGILDETTLTDSNNNGTPDYQEANYPVLTIATTSANISEGNSGTTPFTFTVTRSANTTGITTVDYAVTGVADAADFGGTLPTGTVSFAAGETSKTITINVSGDMTIETDETFTVTLSNPSSSATIAIATAIGTIQNDDLLDSDGDGVTDINDLDDDNDGILDTVENAQLTADIDGDGIPNRLDLDSDNDGISDLLESGNPGIVADVNNDGTISALENPVGANGIPLAAENGVEGGTVPTAVDTDSDGIKDAYDLDSDNDGIFDVVEGGNGALDTNNDGVISSTDTGYADIDADGIVDGTDSNTTAFGGTDTPSVISDSDGDGINDFRELDSDNDGIKDLAESGYGLPDTNTDGIVDGIDTDGDGLVNASTLDANATFGGEVLNEATLTDSNTNGTPDYQEANYPVLAIAATSATISEGNSGTTPFTFTVTRSINTTGATTVDYVVTGVADAADFGGTLPSGIVSFAANETSKVITINVAGDLTIEPDETFTVTLSNPSSPATIATATATGTIQNDDFLDTDGDGVADSTDADDDNDGILDTVEHAVCGPSATTCDTDGDGVPNSLDLDSDNDGINDVIEAGLTDADGNGLADGTIGTNGAVSNAIAVLTALGDKDSDGKRDPYDALNGTTPDGLAIGLPLTLFNGTTGQIICTTNCDPDHDGILTPVDGLPTIWGDAIDTDGDGTTDITDADDDNDGILDTVEHAVCGPSATTCDTDGDGVPNSLDLDSDNDGINDVIEAGLTDADGNGLADGTIGTNGAVSNAIAVLTALGDKDSDGKRDPYDALNGTTPDGLAIGLPLTLFNGTTGQIICTTNCDPDHDGILTPVDGLPTIWGDAIDTDGDGTTDITDADDDNDGILDTVEHAVCGPSATTCDTDGDGVPNSLDLDSDNDGINDVMEAGLTDADGNGLADGTIGTNGAVSNAIAVLTALGDKDSDGKRDPYDALNGTTPDGLAIGLPLTLFNGTTGQIICTTNCDPDHDGILTPVDGLPTIWGGCNRLLMETALPIIQIQMTITTVF